MVSLGSICANLQKLLSSTGKTGLSPKSATTNFPKDAWGYIAREWVRRSHEVSSYTAKSLQKTTQPELTLMSSLIEVKKQKVFARVSTEELESFHSIFGACSLIGVRKRGLNAAQVKNNVTEFELRPVNTINAVAIDLRGYDVGDIGANDIDADFYDTEAHITKNPNFVRLIYDLERRKLTLSVKAAAVVASSQLDQVTRLMQRHSIELRGGEVFAG